MTADVFDTRISRLVWETRYRLQPAGEPAEASIEDTWRRVAAALSARQPADRQQWRERFYSVLRDFSTE